MQAGTSIYMHFGESLHPDGSVLNQYGKIMNANYTCRCTIHEQTPSLNSACQISVSFS